jgi:invasin B
MNVTNIDVLRIEVDVLSNSVMQEKSGGLARANMLKEVEKVFQEIVPVLADVADERMLFDASRRSLGPLRPRLTEPKPFVPDESASRLMEGRETATRNTLLLASMMEILEKGSWHKLAFNANVAVQRDALLTAERNQLVEHYDAAQRKVADALMLLATGEKKLSVLSAKNGETEQQLREVNQMLAMLGDGGDERDAAILLRDSLFEQIRQEKSAFLRMQTQVAISQGNVIYLQGKVNELIPLFDQLVVNLPHQIAKKDINNMERMLMLLTQLGDMMLKVSEVRLETQRSIVKLQEDLRLNKLVEDAEKADRDMAKAEALSKTMGYAGKILGGVVMAASLIGALFTGGASLVLAGIGLGLILADAIYQEVTGNSFMAEAIKPVINLLRPVIESLMNITSRLLEKCGMDAATARIIGLLIVTVTLAVGMVALTLVGMGSAVTRLTSNLIGKLGAVLSRMFEKTMAKITSEVVRQGAKNLSRQISGSIHRAFESVARLLGLPVENMHRLQIVGQHILRMSMIGNAVHVTAVGGFGVVEKSSEVDAEIAVANMRFTSTELSLLQSMFSSLLEQSKNSVSAAMTLFDFNSKAITDFSSAGKAVANAISNARAL